MYLIKFFCTYATIYVFTTSEPRQSGHGRRVISVNSGDRRMRVSKTLKENLMNIFVDENINLRNEWKG